jgi:hypothetical protein
MSYRTILLAIWAFVAFWQICIFVIVQLTHWILGWQWAIAVFAVSEIFHLKWWVDTKEKIFGQLKEKPQTSQSRPQDFPTLDIEEWDRYTDALEVLGFDQIIDFKTESGKSSRICISRLFVDTKNHISVVIAKSFSAPKTEPNPVTVSFLSRLSDEWIFDSTTIKPNGFSYMSRDTGFIFTYHSKIPIPDLFQIHLKRRQEIVDDLGLDILTDVSWEAHCDIENEFWLRFRDNFKRKNIVFALIEATLFEFNPKNEWLGDYPKLAAERKARGL